MSTLCQYGKTDELLSLYKQSRLVSESLYNHLRYLTDRKWVRIPDRVVQVSSSGRLSPRKTTCLAFHVGGQQHIEPFLAFSLSGQCQLQFRLHSIPRCLVITSRHFGNITSSKPERERDTHSSGPIPISMR